MCKKPDLMRLDLGLQTSKRLKIGQSGPHMVRRAPRTKHPCEKGCGREFSTFPEVLIHESTCRFATSLELGKRVREQLTRRGVDVLEKRMHDEDSENEDWVPPKFDAIPENGAWPGSDDGDDEASDSGDDIEEA